MKKKINIIGCSFYSIVLAILIKKDFKNKVSINFYDQSSGFLNAYKPIKIKKFKCNPGFHAFEDIRSKYLIGFLKKFVKFKKIKKTRGIMVKNILISYQKKFWPEKFCKNFSIKKKKINISLINYKKHLPIRYLKYLKNNIGDSRIKFSNSIGMFYPWFFPPNYRLNNKDEGNLFNNKIRKKKINHAFLFPSSGLFQEISLKLESFLKKQNIKLHFNKKINFHRIDKKIHINGINDEKDSINIVCVPVIPLTSSLENFKRKLSTKPVKLFTALLEVKNKDKNRLDRFIEIIVSSHKFIGLRRISLYSEVLNIKKRKIYQIEFVEHKKFISIESQLDHIIRGLSEYLNNDQKIILIGYNFVRMTFSPNFQKLNFIANKVENFFLGSKNIFFPRKITWPINTNKQYQFALIDYKSLFKKKIRP